MNEITDLVQATADRDSYKIQCFVIDQQNESIKKWINSAREEFQTYLSLKLQKSMRTKKMLIHEEDEISYQLGVWEGWLRAFLALQEEELKENDIISMAVEKSPKTGQIILCLYQNGRTMQHGALARTLDMSYNALTNAMKRVISSGAVSVSRTGRSTHYTLTPAACKYCREKLEREAQVTASVKIEALAESLEKIAKQLKASEALSVKPADQIHLYNNEYLSDAKRVASIIQFGGKKILHLEEEPTSNTSIPILESQPQDKFLVSSPELVFKNSYPIPQRSYPLKAVSYKQLPRQPIPKSIIPRYNVPRKQSRQSHSQSHKEI